LVRRANRDLAHRRLGPLESSKPEPPGRDDYEQFAGSRNGQTRLSARVAADGKHLVAGGRPWRVRGVTYGTFLARLDGEPFPDRWQVKADFEAIAGAGLNTVRTYTVPPPEILDIAEECGLRLLVGLQYDDWRMEAHTGRRAQKRVLDSGRSAVAGAMDALAERPSILAVSVGNEVPADLVRVHGASNVEDTLSALVADVHAADEQMLATYTNFPTTEYLHVAGQDVATFNVFLEQPEAMQAYLHHLQVSCGDLPVVITELGLATDVHGEDVQRASLESQLQIVDECGCAGATVFSWTDEWAVGGVEVEGWGFGITDLDRRPKPALKTVARWARSTISDLRSSWPRISVVVCAYNGDQLIEKCLKSLEACDYPELEIVICDDGSTDRTLDIARSFPYRVLELSRVGLGGARNAGMGAANGEIVAFIDADAFCHPEWPYHLVLSLEGSEVAATGGPNLPVPQSDFVERAVARSPGAPVAVLLTDERAEHVAGCNMAFRADVLREVGGFDPVYTTAGDDVDLCWRLLDRRREIAFAPAAQVRHHRRDTVPRYLKQQFGYGRAERLLATRHPHRFNRVGQARWSGSIYGGLGILRRIVRPVIYHGDLGLAPYQTVVRRRPETVLQLVSAMVPWIVAAMLLMVIGLEMSTWWLIGTVTAAVVVLLYGASVAGAVRPGPDEPNPWLLRLLVAFLHAAQPIARAAGRMLGSTPPTARDAPQSWNGLRATLLSELERDLQARGCTVRHRGPHDPEDLEITVGPFGVGCLTTAVLWQSVPVHRLSFRPRPVTVGALAMGVALSLAGAGPTGLVVATFVGAGLTIELVRMKRVVRSSVERITEGAGRGHQLDDGLSRT
jgi:glycosyltransferase involved in cell wall biosynthesis